MAPLGLPAEASQARVVVEDAGVDSCSRRDARRKKPSWAEIRGKEMWSSMFLLGEDGRAGGDAAHDGHRDALRRFLSTSASWTSWTVRDLLGSRLIRPRRSSWLRWLWTSSSTQADRLADLAHAGR